MQQITAYKTRDGFIFDDQHKAIKHSTKVLNDALHNLRLAIMNDCRLSQRDSIAVTEWINANVLHLVEIKAMQDDATMQQAPEDD